MIEAKDLALLIGVGSIGRKHLLVLLAKFSKVIVVDPNPNAIYEFRTSESFERIVHFLDIDNLVMEKEIELAVIANWGPDHFRTLCSLVSKGIKNYIVEKPLADSFAELAAIELLRENNDLRIIVNFNYKFSTIKDVLLNLVKNFDIGEPKAIVVFGGAKCVATVGVHYLALANLIFDDKPKKVSSNLKSNLINPRNIDFKYYEGCANWEYTNDRYLSINFFNSSQVSLRYEILFQRAVIEYSGGTIQIKAVADADQEKLSKPNLTSVPTKLLVLESESDLLGRKNEMEKLYSKIMSGSDLKLEFEFDMGVSWALLAALQSNYSNQNLKLPFESLKELDYEHKWMIS